MNFLVWRRGSRGPIASIDLFDPRSMGDWKQVEPRMIQIVPLPDHQRGYGLDTLIALYACPEVAA